MKWSLVLCIIGASVAFVCICYGAISIYKIKKQEKEQAAKDRMAKHLYLSTMWIMWADLYGIKISNIVPVEESKQGFCVFFSKRSSSKIADLLEKTTVSGILKGNFDKLDNGSYCFANASLIEARHDVEKLMLYYSMMSALSAETGGT